MQDRISNLFFHLIQRGLNPGTPDSSLQIEEREWPAIYALATRQGVSAIVRAGMLRLPKEQQPAKQLQIQWALNTELQEKRYRRQCEAAKELVSIFRENGIEPMLLKGIGLSRYYPVPEYRECGDIDLYPFDGYDKANDLIESLGIRIKYANKKHAEFVFREVPVENHRTFLDINKFRRDRILNEYLTRLCKASQDTIQIDSMKVAVPTPTAEALFFLRHAARHFASGLVVRHLVDWNCFLQRQAEKVDFDTLNPLLAAVRLDDFTAVFTRLAIRYLDLHAEIPPYPSNSPLEEKVLRTILDYDPRPVVPKRFVPRMKYKTGIFLDRRWRYREVLHDNYLQALWYSVLSHIKHPETI